MNRKKRKRRKMQLKRMGLEAFVPHWSAIITTSALYFPHKIAKHFKGNEILAGKLRGYEFRRPLRTK